MTIPKDRLDAIEQSPHAHIATTDELHELVRGYRDGIDTERLQRGWDKAMARSDEIEADRDRLTAEVLRLQAERDAMAKDAERYRWLRGAPYVITSLPCCYAYIDGKRQCIGGAKLDAAIDFAISPAASTGSEAGKPKVHVGLIGHVDSAKTTLTAALTKVAQMEGTK